MGQTVCQPDKEPGFCASCEDSQKCSTTAQRLHSPVQAETQGLASGIRGPDDGAWEGEDAPSSCTSYFDREVKELAALKKSSSQRRNGDPHKFSTGAVYKGQWEKNMRHGYGKQTWPDGASYSGQWCENFASGCGLFTHKDGDVYVGEWETSMASGHGTFYQQESKGGMEYRGEWRFDQQHGHGVETLLEGVHYEGNFQDGRKTGAGCYHWSDGSTYQGIWRENVMHGAGRYRLADGRIYVGQWMDSVMAGLGNYRWPDGREYAGRYSGDHKHGFGVFSWADGRKYKGYWSEGKPTGEAKYVGPDGSVGWYTAETGVMIDESMSNTTAPSSKALDKDSDAEMLLTKNGEPKARELEIPGIEHRLSYQERRNEASPRISTQSD